MTSAHPSRYWMNAVAGDEVVVPRKGYLVEVNALWYNALKCAEKYALECGCADSAKKFGEAAEKCAKSFNDTFWSFDMKGLYDSVDPETFKTTARSARTRYWRPRCPSARYRRMRHRMWCASAGTSSTLHTDSAPSTRAMTSSRAVPRDAWTSASRPATAAWPGHGCLGSSLPHTSKQSFA